MNDSKIIKKFIAAITFFFFFSACYLDCKVNAKQESNTNSHRDRVIAVNCFVELIQYVHKR